MVDQYKGPFATYTNLTNICVAAAKTEIRTLFINYAALYGITLNAACTAATFTDGSSNPHTDFDQVHPSFRAKIADELIAMYAAIEAAPVV